LRKRAGQSIGEAKDAETLEKVRVKYLGRNGELTKILRSLASRPLRERREIGLAANKIKQELLQLFDQKLSQIKAVNFRPGAGLDLTLPGKKVRAGHFHPLTLVENRIREIFLGLNFSVVEGPEVETEHNNFEALNIPNDHPARDLWSTFYLKDQQPETGGRKPEAGERKLLRTHTSPMQIRYMLIHQPPFQIIVPGRVFRYEATDSSHEINFYQIEGLMVGQNISLANFKYVVSQFFNRFFGKPVPLRFRPSYFPFVEPGLEVDLRLGDQWLEIMGAGLVHPKVFEAVRYNHQQWQGFAFGLGTDRLAMLKYGIDDIRLFYSGDLRFVRQF